MKIIENPELEEAVIRECRAAYGDEWAFAQGVSTVVRITLGVMEEAREKDREAQEFQGDLSFRDFTAYPGELKSAIDRGEVDGVVAFHRIRAKDQPERIGMMSGGLTSAQAFTILCTARRTLMQMLGLSDPEPLGEAVQNVEHAVTKGATVQEKHCSRCGIDHWGVLDKCPYQDCPHGLFR